MAFKNTQRSYDSNCKLALVPLGNRYTLHIHLQGGPKDHTSVSNQERDILFYSIHGGWPPRKQVCHIFVIGKLRMNWNGVKFPGGTEMVATEAWDQYMFGMHTYFLIFEELMTDDWSK